MACCLQNADNPDQPEYGKKYKPDQHVGCCCNFGCGDDVEEADDPETVKQTLTRADFTGE